MARKASHTRVYPFLPELGQLFEPAWSSKTWPGLITKRASKWGLKGPQNGALNDWPLLARTHVGLRALVIRTPERGPCFFGNPPMALDGTPKPPGIVS